MHERADNLLAATGTYDADARPGSSAIKYARQVRSFVVLLAIVGIGLTATLVGRFSPRVSHPLPLLVLSGLFFIAESMRVELNDHGTALTINALGAAMVVAVLTGRPREVVIAATVATIAHGIAVRRLAAPEVVFQAARTLATTSVAVLMFFSLKPGRNGDLPSIAAAIIACAEWSVLTALATGVVIALNTRRLAITEILRGLVAGVIATLVAGSVGAQAVLLAHRSYWLLPLVGLPLVVSVLALRSYAIKQGSRLQHDFIQRATASLHHDRDLGSGLAGALGEVRDALHAEFARAVLFSSEGSLSVVAHRDASRSVTNGDPTGEVVETALRLAQRLDGPQIVTISSTSRELLGALGVEHGIAAPLFHAEKLAGLLVVANREHDVEVFDAHDRSMVGLVARQIEIAVERGWLEQSMRHLVELERQLAHQAYHDGLTSLANRRRFNEHLEEVLPSGAPPSPSALLMIDLDGFKQVNDNHGHEAGDQLLATIGRRLGVLVRSGDLVARIGGDEFALVLAGIDDISTAARRAERVIEAIEQPARIRDYELRISASVGIALVDGDTLSPAELLRNADLALYHAKGMGKGRFALYDPAMRAAAQTRRHLLSELELAIARREFEVYYQPIHDIISGQLLGAEALIRWQHPVLGKLEPSAFLPVAEQSGLIAPIGELMLDDALATAAGWVDSMAPDQAFTLNVNLSARQLHDPRLVEVVRSSLVRAGLEPGRLVIEITESALIEDIDRTKDIVEQLIRVGVHVALDDFGTGYSSLSHVRSFPLHHLKIDKSFVESIATNPTDGAIVGSIVHLAGALGVVAVAEGIETPEQLAELRRRGCRVGQGYLMSEPLDATAFRNLLRRYRSTAWLLRAPSPSTLET